MPSASVNVSANALEERLPRISPSARTFIVCISLHVSFYLETCATVLVTPEREKKKGENRVLFALCLFSPPREEWAKRKGTCNEKIGTINEEKGKAVDGGWKEEKTGTMKILDRNKRKRKMITEILKVVGDENK